MSPAAVATGSSSRANRSASRCRDDSIASPARCAMIATRSGESAGISSSARWFADRASGQSADAHARCASSAYASATRSG